MTRVPESRTRAQNGAEHPLIVVGVDGSDAALAAVELAAEHAGPGGTVVPVHVVEPVPGWLGAPYYHRMVVESQRDARRLLDRTKQFANGTRVKPEMVEGEPVEALLRLAEARGADAIVVGSRGLGRIRGLLGSVSRALVERATVPVTVVPPDQSADR